MNWKGYRSNFMKWRTKSETEETT